MAFQDNTIYECSYCGERVKSKAKYCKDCGTQAGRKKVFDANAAIMRQREKDGLPFQKTLRDWK